MDGTQGANRIPQWLAIVAGPLFVMLAALTLEALEAVLFRVPMFDLYTPNPETSGMVLLATVIIVLDRLGLAAGMASLAAMLAYRIYYLSIPGQPFQYTPEGLVRVLIVVSVSGLIVWTFCRIREAGLSAVRSETQRVLAEEYARHLEQVVEQRTAELSQAYDDLKELDRLKTELVNTVSHELRTPLTAIRGYAEFLEDEIAGPINETQLEYVNHITANSKRLQRLVDDLLDLARLEVGTFRLEVGSSDLGRAVEEVVASVQPIADSRAIQLATCLPPEPVVAMADANRIEQVLTNLLTNAIKFTPPNGHVKLTVDKKEDAWEFVVEDDGIGIPADKLPHIFDKFYQVDGTSTRVAGGVGLGLSIAKALVEAHGGRIDAESQVGKGTAFRFSLPLC
jgi:signal transduction histidine kinase